MLLLYPKGSKSPGYSGMLPGCWHTWTRPRQPEPAPKLLAVVSVATYTAAEGVQGPTVPAGPPRVGGGAALVVENTFWHVLDEGQQRRWRLPPAAPAFRSSLLRHDGLPALAGAVLAASNRSGVGHACTGPCSKAAEETLGLSVTQLQQEWQFVLYDADLANTFGDACQQGRGVRMRRSAPSVAAWRRWWQLFSAAAWVPVGAGLEGLTRCLLLAVRSQWSRQAAGTGK